MAGATQGLLLVLGSVNHDIIVFVDAHPAPGETVVAHSSQTGLGGKGANQAVAGVRAGVHTALISAVGDDAAGRELIAGVQAHHVDTTQVATVAGAISGTALITVDSHGENSIVVAPGAANALDARTVAAACSAACAEGSVLLAQLELPTDVVEAACLAAHAAGARVALNLSPAQPISEELLAICDPLIMNVHEAQELLGFAIADNTVERAVRRLAERCVSVVITLGSDGAAFGDTAYVERRAAPQVAVVDTTGAGDAFAGALAAALVQGNSLADAVERGIAAGAIAVQHVGAQPPASTA